MKKGLTAAKKTAVLLTLFVTLSTMCGCTDNNTDNNTQTTHSAAVTSDTAAKQTSADIKAETETQAEASEKAEPAAFEQYADSYGNLVCGVIDGGKRLDFTEYGSVRVNGISGDCAVLCSMDSTPAFSLSYDEDCNDIMEIWAMDEVADFYDQMIYCVNIETGESFMPLQISALDYPIVYCALDGEHIYAVYTERTGDIPSDSKAYEEMIKTSTQKIAVINAKTNSVTAFDTGIPSINSICSIYQLGTDRIVFTYQDKQYYTDGQMRINAHYMTCALDGSGMSEFLFDEGGFGGSLSYEGERDNLLTPEGSSNSTSYEIISVSEDKLYIKRTVYNDSTKVRDTLVTVYDQSLNPFAEIDIGGEPEMMTDIFVLDESVYSCLRSIYVDGSNVTVEKYSFDGNGYYPDKTDIDTMRYDCSPKNVSDGIRKLYYYNDENITRIVCGNYSMELGADGYVSDGIYINDCIQDFSGSCMVPSGENGIYYFFEREDMQPLYDLCAHD